MSTRSFGMVGKTYRTSQEAFKDATYATGIEMPLKNEYSHVWAVLWVVAALGLVAYVFSRF